MIAQAKAAPGKLNYGAGTITSQLMGYRFHKAAGIDIQYVPFKGTPATVNGLLTGSVQLIYASNTIVNPLIESGKVRALARLDRRHTAFHGRCPDTGRRRRPAKPGGHVGLARPRRAEGHAEADHRQASSQGRGDSGRSGDAGETERTGAFAFTSTPEEFAQIHPPGGGPLGAGVEGNQHPVRLSVCPMDDLRRTA